MRFAVIVFPGSNCDSDMFHAVTDALGAEARYVRHDDTSLDGFDAILIPGGFSYGDYLRCGAMAAVSPIIPALRKAAGEGRPILGVCNGFQVLTEAGLLPGALLRNGGMRFVCKTVGVRVANAGTGFTKSYGEGEVLRLPIAHGEGNYFCDGQTLERLCGEGRIAFAYEDNPNGSVGDIAGITNERGNVLGMMPHPERAAEALLGSADGLGLFESILRTWGGA